MLCVLYCVCLRCVVFFVCAFLLYCVCMVPVCIALCLYCACLKYGFSVGVGADVGVFFAMFFL